MTTRMHAFARRGALALALATLSGCSWFTDFKQQPKVDPWESPADSIPFRGQPQMSVPVTGTAAAGFQVSRAPLPGTIDSMSAIRNPVPADERSLANGRKYFQINCAVCHGLAGNGDGTAVKYGMPGIALTMDMTRNRTDGYIFGMIRNGRGMMPTYNRIEEMDRWDVVNYVRALQNKTAVTGPVGQPGETGQTLPGATTLGPTRPAPFVHPGQQTGAVTMPSMQQMLQGAGASAPGAAADSAHGAMPMPAAPGAATPATPASRDTATKGKQP